jgi:hypothetical protein
MIVCWGWDNVETQETNRQSLYSRTSAMRSIQRVLKCCVGIPAHFQTLMNEISSYETLSSKFLCRFVHQNPTHSPHITKTKMGRLLEIQILGKIQTILEIVDKNIL